MKQTLCKVYVVASLTTLGTVMCLGMLAASPWLHVTVRFGRDAGVRSIAAVRSNRWVFRL